jgi:hypothetical protein
MTIRAGMLVRPRYSPTIEGTNRAVGLVISVDESFYGLGMSGEHRMDRLHIVWQNGSTTTEPESYLDVIEEGDTT